MDPFKCVRYCTSGSEVSFFVGIASLSQKSSFYQVKENVFSLENHRIERLNEARLETMGKQLPGLVKTDILWMIDKIITSSYISQYIHVPY